jgi:hypothetical protein
MSSSPTIGPVRRGNIFAGEARSTGESAGTLAHPQHVDTFCVWVTLPPRHHRGLTRQLPSVSAGALFRADETAMYLARRDRITSPTSGSGSFRQMKRHPPSDPHHGGTCRRRRRCKTEFAGVLMIFHPAGLVAERKYVSPSTLMIRPRYSGNCHLLRFLPVPAGTLASTEHSGDRAVESVLTSSARRDRQQSADATVSRLSVASRRGRAHPSCGEPLLRWLW